MPSNKRKIKKRIGFSNVVVKIASLSKVYLKLQSCILCNSKYMITLTQITSGEIFAFIADLGFKSLNRKDLFINRKDNGTC